MRPGLRYTVAAAVFAGTAALGVSATAVEGRVVVNQLLILALIVYLFLLLVGSARWIGVSSVPLLIAAGIEGGFGEDPVWIRSMVIGCLWFLAVEAGWEAIDRRRGVRYTAAASAKRLQEVFTVVGVAAFVGAVATLAAALAPTRSVLLQAVVVGGLLGAFAVVVRGLVPDRSEDGILPGGVSRPLQTESDQRPFPDGRSGPERFFPVGRAGDRQRLR